MPTPEPAEAAVQEPAPEWPANSPGPGLAPLAQVIAATAVFAVLLALVWLRWAPLESADRAAADHVNRLVAAHPAVITLVRYVTTLGSTLVLSVVTATGAVLLALRRCWRLAAYLIVAVAGEMILDPLLKNLVGRVRPAGRSASHGSGSPRQRSG